MRAMRPSGRPERSEGAALRRDPAPSRIAYRLNRLWLRPSVRFGLRFGLPFLLVIGALGFWLGDSERRAGIEQVWVDLRDTVKNRPEFLVTMLVVEGASDDLAAEVRARINVALPQSSFDIDLDAAHDRVTAIDAVRDVVLRVQSGGVLQASVREREPVLVWRHRNGLTLLDETGHRVNDIFARADRSDLPLIAGEGAPDAVPEVLQMIAAAGPLLPRLRGVVRVGERRWDLVLDRDQRILLPVREPVRAIERLLALDQAQDMLARDVRTVDLRLVARPVIGLGPHALREMRRARGLISEEESAL